MNSSNDRLLWLNGKIIPAKDALVNIMSPTAQFGANVFEGIRCYWNKDNQQLYAFRLEEHYTRLKNSIKMFRIEDKYSAFEMKQGLIEIIRANNYREDIAVRQTVFLDGFGSWSSSEPVGMLIAPIPKGCAYPNKEGIRCCISSWERISDRNISPKVKVGANYINSRYAQLEAINNGYDSAIFMNSQGKISEGPGSCLFMIRDGKLITPPCTASVLESITRNTLLVLAKNELNLETIEREIDRTELYICDETFLCGSAMEVVPILSVDGIPVGEGKGGEITTKLRDLYMNTVRGKLDGYSKWLTEVY